MLSLKLTCSSYSRSDYLLVTEPGTGNYHGKYCGMNRTQITSTGHQLFLKFKSDNFNPGVGKGFLLNYTIKGRIFIHKSSSQSTRAVINILWVLIERTKFHPLNSENL